MAKFYYLNNGAVCGPESLQKIRGKIVLNFLPEDVQVCEEDRDEWVQIRDVKEEPWEVLISQKIDPIFTLPNFLTFFGWVNIVLLIVALSTQSWQTALYALFVLLGAIQPGIRLAGVVEVAG